MSRSPPSLQAPGILARCRRCPNSASALRKQVLGFRSQCGSGGGGPHVPVSNEGGSLKASPLATRAPLADILVRPEARRMSLHEGALASATRASLRPDHLARRPFGCDPGKAPCDVRRRSYADARSSPSTRVG